MRCTHMFPRQTIPLTSRTLFGWQTMLDLVEIIYLEERRDRNAQSEIFSTAVYYMCNWRHKIWSNVICIFKIWGVLLFYRLFHSTIQMSLIISMTRVIAQLSWFVNLIFICYLSTHTNTKGIAGQTNRHTAPKRPFRCLIFNEKELLRKILCSEW